MPSYRILPSRDEVESLSDISDVDQRGMIDGFPSENSKRIGRCKFCAAKRLAVALFFAVGLVSLFVTVAWHLSTSKLAGNHTNGHRGMLPTSTTSVASAYFGTQHKWDFDVVFKRNTNWFNMSHEWDNRWRALAGKNSGLFSVYDAKAGRERPWGIGMFHQLHCLAILRSQIQHLQEAVAGIHSDTNGTHGMRLDSVHFEHCFDYLRQVSTKTIMAGRFWPLEWTFDSCLTSFECPRPCCVSPMRLWNRLLWHIVGRSILLMDGMWKLKIENLLY